MLNSQTAGYMLQSPRNQVNKSCSPHRPNDIQLDADCQALVRLKFTHGEIKALRDQGIPSFVDIGTHPFGDLDQHPTVMVQIHYHSFQLLTSQLTLKF